MMGPLDPREDVAMMTRRDFVAGAAVAVGTLGAAGQAPSGRRPMLPIVDTHQHLWDLSRIRPPWLREGNPLARDHTTREYLAATKGLHVVKAVYMEIAVAEADLVAEAEQIAALCESGKTPTVAAVIGGRPASDGFADYLARFKDRPCVKGVRQIVHRRRAPRHPCLEPAFVRGIRLLGEVGLSFDLCVGPAELLDGARLVAQCPDTRFVVTHCGNADPKAFRPSPTAKPSHEPDLWRRGMDALAKQPNTICKISGIVARVPKEWSADDLAPIVNHCLDAFGPDRVVFGSDWPVCTRGAPLRAWVEALRAIVRSRPEAEQRKLLHDNAVRFYRLGA